jgi:putative PIG3 family NAD(P)H quinone oxidoreductase
MNAILLDHFGDESVLHLGEASAPPLGHDDIRIAVRAAGINRADLLQRQGSYPPPPGASEILGMECAGEVVEVGPGADGWRVGQRAMALIPGGGYATEVVCPGSSAMHVPDALSWEEAGALPEVFLTAFSNLFLLARLQPAETALIHGGGSGVGTAALMMCKLSGVKTIVTVGSQEKGRQCIELGAKAAIHYKSEDFGVRARELTGGKGVDVILDHIGARYLAQDLAALAPAGRLVVIGTMGGVPKAELDFGILLGKRIQIIGSTLRGKSTADKGEIVRNFLARFGAALESGTLKPIVYKSFPLAAAGEAHRLMNSSEHFGKIVLTM